MSKRRRVPADEKRRSRRSYARPPAFDALWGKYHGCETPEEYEQRMADQRHWKRHGWPRPAESHNRLVVDMCGYDVIPESERYQVIDGPPVVPDWAGQVIENVYGEPDED